MKEFTAIKIHNLIRTPPVLVLVVGLLFSQIEKLTV